MREVLQPGTTSSQWELQRRKSGHTPNVGWGDPLSERGKQLPSLPSRLPPNSWTPSPGSFCEPENSAAAGLPQALL